MGVDGQLVALVLAVAVPWVALASVALAVARVVGRAIEAGVSVTVSRQTDARPGLWIPPVETPATGRRSRRSRHSTGEGDTAPMPMGGDE